MKAPFGEDGAEMVGQPQRDEEGVGHRPGAEHRGQHDVADKAGDAREQREAADREDAFNHQGNPAPEALMLPIDGLEPDATIAIVRYAELP